MCSLCISWYSSCPLAALYLLWQHGWRSLEASDRPQNQAYLGKAGKEGSVPLRGDGAAAGSGVHLLHNTPTERPLEKENPNWPCLPRVRESASIFYPSEKYWEQPSFDICGCKASWASCYILVTLSLDRLFALFITKVVPAACLTKQVYLKCLTVCLMRLKKVFCILSTYRRPVKHLHLAPFLKIKEEKFSLPCGAFHENASVLFTTHYQIKKGFVLKFFFLLNIFLVFILVLLVRNVSLMNNISRSFPLNGVEHVMDNSI